MKRMCICTGFIKKYARPILNKYISQVNVLRAAYHVRLKQEKSYLNNNITVAC